MMYENCRDGSDRAPEHNVNDFAAAAVPLSCNDAVGRRVPTHPGPLPRGEGEPFGSKGHRLLSFPARSKRAPSPLAEGRGEGERDVRTAWIRLSHRAKEGATLRRSVLAFQGSVLRAL